MDAALIERLAREAGMYFAEDDFPDRLVKPEIECKPDSLAQFAALVAEECAKILDADLPIHERFDGQRAWGNALRKNAKAIRDRFKPSGVAPDPVPSASSVETARLKAILSFIEHQVGDSNGGELHPVGPADVEYSADGNTIIRHVPPWTWMRSTGATFLEAVENEMKAQMAKGWYPPADVPQLGGQGDGCGGGGTDG